MSGRQLVRLAAVLAALLLLWGAVALAGRRSGTGAGAERLLAADTSRVDSVVVTSARDTAVLVRGADGWTVDGHPAAKEEIAGLLVALADTARFDLVAESEASHARLGVTADSGHKVRISGGRSVELIVAERSSGFGGGYARRADGPSVYQLRGELPRLVTRPPDDWRDKTIATVDTDSIASVTIARGRERYQLRREGARWRFANGGLADSLRAADLLRELGRISAAGFATPAQRDSTSFTRPDRRLMLESAGDRTLVALVFDSTDGGFWVRHDSGGTVWRLDSWVADRLTPAAVTLR